MRPAPICGRHETHPTFWNGGSSPWSGSTPTAGLHPPGTMAKQSTDSGRRCSYAELMKREKSLADDAGGGMSRAMRGVVGRT